jgi:glycosyltransferase involved in cell wall biosynthesis
MPKISVITTLYNYANYIGDAINSFVRQTFDDVEMIVVDDASTDNGAEVVTKWVDGDPRVKYIRLNKNSGYSCAKNVGIKASDSDVIVMLDADDKLTENSLEIRYGKIKDGYDLVHGPALDLRDGNLVKSKMWRQWKKTKNWKFVHAQGVMLRKQIHKDIGLYDENLRCKSDREMWARIFNRGYRIGTVSDYVAVYRVHSKQMHRSKEKKKHNKRLQAEVLELINRRKSDLGGLTFLD